ncbi:cupin domain-containing protein [Gammaproteobacteria bacterium AH-315-K14]|nr:cupin domain-containing protein [Gammaproteobacteria bacterium AH-315-K14]
MKTNDYRLNMNVELPAVLRVEEQLWVTSPADGVSRLPLEREARESGHTTSFVKFEPGSHFPEHAHPQGEEIYVLDGVFSDENDDYPAGTYIRNPPGSQHTPFTEQGCTLFVKLDQFQSDDKQAVVLRPEDQQWRPGIGNLKVLSLHTYNTESTALVLWPENEVFQAHTHWGGEEIVVISGKFIDEFGEYPALSWIRSPHMSQHFPRVEEQTLILVKVGHLNL